MQRESSIEILYADLGRRRLPESFLRAEILCREHLHLLSSHFFSSLILSLLFFSSLTLTTAALPSCLLAYLLACLLVSLLAFLAWLASLACLLAFLALLASLA